MNGFSNRTKESQVLLMQFFPEIPSISGPPFHWYGRMVSSFPEIHTPLLWLVAIFVEYMKVNLHSSFVAFYTQEMIVRVIYGSSIC